MSVMNQVIPCHRIESWPQLTHINLFFPWLVNLVRDPYIIYWFRRWNFWWIYFEKMNSLHDEEKIWDSSFRSGKYVNVWTFNFTRRCKCIWRKHHFNLDCLILKIDKSNSFEHSNSNQCDILSYVCSLTIQN